MEAGPIHLAALTTVVERILSAALDEIVSVGSGQPFPEHTTVFRFPVAAHSTHAPASVVVKLAPDWQPYDPDTTAFPAPAWFLFNNWAMERAYREELMQGCAAAADDELFARAVVDACAHWVLSMFQDMPLADVLAEDKPWGIATRRQRYLLRLPIVAQLTEEHHHLEALGTTLRAMGARLHQLWPAAADELPTYMAFR